MTRKVEPSDQHKQQLFRDSIYYEIIHTFGVPSNLTNEQLDAHAIGEIINFSRHVHARLLSHFLFRRPSDGGTKDDDVFAVDFGFDHAPSMTDAERKHMCEHVDLNKGLLHLTYGRVKGATTKPWSSSILKDLLPVTIAFMKHIRDNEVLPTGAPLFADTQERKGWATLLDCLERCQAGMRLRFGSGFQDSWTWYKLSIEVGSISELYGTRAGPIPAEATLIESPTNTSSQTSIWNDA